MEAGIEEQAEGRKASWTVLATLYGSRRARGIPTSHLHCRSALEEGTDEGRERETRMT